MEVGGGGKEDSWLLNWASSVLQVKKSMPLIDFAGLQSDSGFLTCGGHNPNLLLMTKFMTAGVLGALQAGEAVGGSSTRKISPAADFTLSQVCVASSESTVRQETAAL